MEIQKELHPRNIHNQKYDFESLIKDTPALSSFVKKNQYNTLTIDYSNPHAILCLNKALLSYHYKVTNWQLPKNHLCPPIPGRADYIHYIADILAKNNDGKVPVGPSVKILDIGTGASCIYPILGNSIYGWKFIATDISSVSINNIKEILNQNQTLKKNIKVRFQKDKSNIFKNIIKNDEKFDLTMCNPPFFTSLEEANEARSKKVNNLNKNKQRKGHKSVDKKTSSNFGGTSTERYCDGGELDFIQRIIKESLVYKDQCRWFSTLVSNKANIEQFTILLQSQNSLETKVIEMNQGQKIAHLLIWRY